MHPLFCPSTSQIDRCLVHCLVHLPDEFIDTCFPVTKVTALDVMVKFAFPPATGRVRQLEGPQEV